jgi:hypothetical protein
LLWALGFGADRKSHASTTAVGDRTVRSRRQRSMSGWRRSSISVTRS